MQSHYAIATLLAMAWFVGFVGCKQQSATTINAPAATTGDHGHEHANGADHDHSVVGHGHSAGPHDGVVADWGGGKYHVELAVDHHKTQATVYVFGGDEETPAPIDAQSIELCITDPEMLVKLNAAPEDSDPKGKASRFIGTHEKLSVVQEYEGTLTGVIDGTPYSGDFKEEAH